MSVVHVCLGRPRDLLPSIFNYISCSCDESFANIMVRAGSLSILPLTTPRVGNAKRIPGADRHSLLMCPFSQSHSEPPSRSLGACTGSPNCIYLLSTSSVKTPELLSDNL